jgi:hypothetical protein
MSTSEKLQMLFEAALVEPETASSSRMVALPRNPNGSQSSASENLAAGHDSDHFDPRREMLARVSRMKSFLSGG